MSILSDTFPRAWQKATAVYSYFLPASLWLSKELSFPMSLPKQLEDAFKAAKEIKPEKQDEWREVSTYIRAVRQATKETQRLTNASLGDIQKKSQRSKE